MSLNRLVLVLNGSYEPINICPARRAFVLLCKGAAVVEEVSAYTVHTAKLNLPIPSVIRLMNYRRIPRQNRAVSRRGIILRDGSSCQYCGAKLPAGALTLDHVIPRSRRGGSTWSNLVASCRPCNLRKGDNTPEEAGMPLLHKPMQLSIHAKHRLLRGDDDHLWDAYLFG